MADYPAPLTPPDCDLQDFPFMPLQVSRLRDSDFAATNDPEACWYAVLLWCAAWHQLPAASLPDNDNALMRLCGLGRDVKTWRKHRDGALYGFVKCSDGRLYHPVIAEEAKNSWRQKLEQRWRTECARIRKANQRQDKEDSQPTFDEWLLSQGHADLSHGTGENVPRDTGDLSQGQSCEIASKGQGQGQGQGQGYNNTIPPTPLRNSDAADRRLDAPAGPGLDGGDGQDREGVGDDTPAARWLPRIADAGGLALTAPKRRAAIAHIAGWLDGWPGCDLERDLLEPIRAHLAEHPGPTRSLARFDAPILDRKARAAPRSTAAQPGSAPPPHLAEEGPDEAAIRAAVAAEIGPGPTTAWLDPCRLALNCEALHVTAPSAFVAEHVENHYRRLLAIHATARAGRTIAVAVRRAAPAKPASTTPAQPEGALP